MTENYDLCLEILKRLHRVKVLDKIVVIGSWCLVFYKQYFQDKTYSHILFTRDIDLLIPLPPPKWPADVDIPSLLYDLDFVVMHSASTGAIKLSHPMLNLEFLVPEQGRGSDKPMELPELKINAQRLRFLNYLLEDSVKVHYEGLPLRLPHPARFALHKLIVATRRKNKEKAARDVNQALSLLHTIFQAGEEASLTKALDAMPRGWINILKKQLPLLQKEFPGLAEHSTAAKV
jgi:hypothetical protein